MSVKEILTSVNLIGGTDAITFEAFIIRKLVPKLWKGACVVMDNCPFHLGEDVKKAIEKIGNCSPQLRCGIANDGDRAGLCCICCKCSKGLSQSRRK